MDTSLIMALKNHTQQSMHQKGSHPPTIEALERSFFGTSDIELLTHEFEANSIGAHYHNFFEINYVVYGTCNQVLEGCKPVTLHSGDFCIMNPHATHTCTIPTKDDIVLNLLIKPELFNSTFFTFISDKTSIGQFLLSYAFQDTTGAGNYLLFQNCYSDYVDSLLTQIIREYFSGKPYAQVNIRCLLILLFSELLNNTAQNSRNSMETLMNQVMDYISENLSTVSLKSVAEHFYLNPNYLSTYIRQQTGYTYTDIITSLRLAQAKNLLSGTSISIADISVLLGYKDPLSFHNMFKLKTGLTPTQFRQTQQGGILT